LGSRVVSWFSWKQKSVPLSLAEEETWQLDRPVARPFGFVSC
jgi:hypothetical protein